MLARQQPHSQQITLYYTLYINTSLFQLPTKIYSEIKQLFFFLRQIIWHVILWHAIRWRYISIEIMAHSTLKQQKK